MDNDTYFSFIRDAIESDGWNVADNANKLALKMGKISTDQYLQAAQIIVKAYLN